MSEQNPRLDPAWKQAVLDFLDLDPQPGTVIDEAWLCDHFELPKPVVGGEDTWQRWQLKFLSYRDNFRTQLGEDFNIQLSDKENGQLRVLHPSEVAEYTEAKARRELRAALRKRSWKLKHTDLLGMDAAARGRHLEAMARTQLQAKLLREAEKAELPKPKEPAPLPRLFQTGDPDQEGEPA